MLTACDDDARRLDASGHALMMVGADPDPAASIDGDVLSALTDGAECSSTAHRCSASINTFSSSSSHSSSPASAWLLPRAGPDDRARWADARRRGPGWRLNCGTGNAPGSLAAMSRFNLLTMACQQPGCCALVDYKAARRQALHAGRVAFAPGDGCAARSCSVDHRPARFARRQLAMAAHLDGGKRLLVRWPSDRGDREVWVLPADEARDAADAARMAIEPLPAARLRPRPAPGPRPVVGALPVDRYMDA